MPFKSKKQQRFAYASKQKWAKEWSEETKKLRRGKKKGFAVLPDRVEKALGPHQTAIKVAAQQARLGKMKFSDAQASADWAQKQIKNANKRTITKRKAEITGPRMQALDLNTDECVEWPGAMREGYGVKKMGNTTINAHRWVYEQSTGKKIPKGIAIDHTCRNRKCVNPKHLEAVTHSENKTRAWGAKSGSYTHKNYRGEPVSKQSSLSAFGVDHLQ